MLEYISNSTFDSMMDLNKEETKKVDTKQKAPAKGAKENKE
jgi:hypothetical protein